MIPGKPIRVDVTRFTMTVSLETRGRVLHLSRDEAKQLARELRRQVFDDWFREIFHRVIYGIREDPR